MKSQKQHSFNLPENHLNTPEMLVDAPKTPTDLH